MRATAAERARGSASIQVVALVGVLLLLGLGASFVAATAVAHRRAQAAADLAALAGAVALQRGEDACRTAEQVAARNGGTGCTCRVVGEEVVVESQVRSPEFLGHTWRIVGRSRAGPEPAAGSR